MNFTVRSIAAVVLAIPVALAVGCGSSDDSQNDKPPGGDNQGSLGPPTILRLSYDDGKGDKQTARLTCSDEGNDATGFLAQDADAACSAIARGPVHDLLLPDASGDSPPRARVCTQVYGGPETLRISGRVNYKTFGREFKRTNGCEIAEWKSLSALRPPTGK